jgi:transcriptional regulator with XRE-family HTH domain
MATLHFNLKPYLERHNITTYRLAKDSGITASTLYGLARKRTQNIDLATVSRIIDSLQRLTGRKVSITDLLENTNETASINPQLTALLKNAKPFKATTTPTWTSEELEEDERYWQAKRLEKQQAIELERQRHKRLNAIMDETSKA